MKTITKLQLKNLKFVISLPLEERKEAYQLIDRGADFMLLSFWNNLRQGTFYPLFTMEQVDQLVVVNAERCPEFTQDILQWFRAYKQTVIDREIENS
ncbi:MAG: hypothetical protein WKF87_06615 [Chryseolinea sp.]